MFISFSSLDVRNLQNQNSSKNSTAVLNQNPFLQTSLLIRRSVPPRLMGSASVSTAIGSSLSFRALRKRSSISSVAQIMKKVKNNIDKTWYPCYNYIITSSIKKGGSMMDIDVKNFNVIDFREARKPSQLEREYVEQYGQEFVDDLKRAYYWMRMEIKKQPSTDEIARKRSRNHHEIGNRVSVFYVDFRREDFYSMTIDEFGYKTKENCGHSPCLRAGDNHNIRYLLSGMFFYDKNKTRKWIDELLGPGEKCWAQKV